MKLFGQFTVLCAICLSVYSVNAYASICEDGRSSVACIQERGYIVAATAIDSKPFGFQDKDGKPVGFDVDILKAFSKCWFGDDSEARLQIIQINSADRLDVLINREVDLVSSSMTYTYDRDKSIDFSHIYFLDGQRILVRKDSDMARDIQPSDDFSTIAKYLPEKTISVVERTTSLDNIKARTEEHDVSVKYRVVLQWGEAIDLLKNGAVDVVTTDGVILDGYAKENPDLLVVGAAFSDEPYAIGVSEGDSSMRRLVNITMQNIWKSGEYQHIFRKWFPDRASWPLYKIDTFPGNTDMSPFSNACRPFPSPELITFGGENQQECSEYTVRRGDSLSGIAEKFYSSANKFSSIYAHNKDRIGPDPHIIQVGTRLRICLSW